MVTFDEQVDLRFQNCVNPSFFKFIKILANMEKNLRFRNKGYDCFN